MHVKTVARRTLPEVFSFFSFPPTTGLGFAATMRCHWTFANGKGALLNAIILQVAAAMNESSFKIQGSAEYGDSTPFYWIVIPCSWGPFISLLLHLQRRNQFE